jgi:hypothetical protein
MCTVTLHGPWGVGRNMVFVRISFDFPKAYPSDPNAMPTFDLDKNPLLSSNRTAIIAELDSILSGRKGVLEPCLSFLRFGARDRTFSPGAEADSDSEEEDFAAENMKKGNIARIMKLNKNLGEPRTSQGVFAPNGWCAFRVKYRY